MSARTGAPREHKHTVPAREWPWWWPIAITWVMTLVVVALCLYVAEVPISRLWHW